MVFLICVVLMQSIASCKEWLKQTMFVLVTGVEMFPVMEKMNKPIPHHLSFLRPVSTVSVAAILIYEPLPCVVSTPWLCMVKCHLPRSGMKGVRGHEPSQYSSASLLLFTFCCIAHPSSQSRGRRAQRPKVAAEEEGIKGPKYSHTKSKTQHYTSY